MHIRMIYAFMLLMLVSNIHAHEWSGKDTLIHKVAEEVDPLFEKKTKKLEKKYTSLSKGMDKANNAALNRFQRISKKILKKRNSTDSSFFPLNDQ